MEKVKFQYVGSDMQMSLIMPQQNSHDIYHISMYE